MHGEPDTELEFEGFWQQAHQIRILLCEPHLSDTDTEARLDCAQLRDVAVGSEGKAKGIGARHATAHAADSRRLAVKADQAVLRQIAESGGRAGTREIILVRMKAQADRAQLLDHQSFLRRLDHAHGDVSVAAQEIVQRIGEGQFELQSGMVPAQFRQHGRQYLGAHDLARADAHGTFDGLRRQR